LGIYIPGELGIRHEDTVVVTDSGCENLAPKWSGTPEEPAVVGRRSVDGRSRSLGPFSAVREGKLRCFRPGDIGAEELQDSSLRRGERIDL